MIRKVIQICFFLVFNSQIYGQDVAFTQFLSSPSGLNPAFTGNSCYSLLSLNYRNHVPAQQSNFVTYSLFYDQPIQVIKGGAGVHFFLDQVGSFSQLNFGGSNAVTINLTKDYSLATGFQYDLFQSRINTDDFVFDDPTEVVQSNSSKVKVDLSIGTLLFDDQKFIGIKVGHLTQPSLSLNGSKGNLYSLKRVYSIHAGWNIPLDKNAYKNKTFVVPLINFMHQDNSNIIISGAYLRTAYYMFGIFYRNNLNFETSALSVLLGVRFNNYKLAYSYDWSLSKYGYSDFGAHEISFSYFFETNSSKMKYKAINCLSF